MPLMLPRPTHCLTMNVRRIVPSAAALFAITWSLSATSAVPQTLGQSTNDQTSGATNIASEPKLAQSEPMAWMSPQSGDKFVIIGNTLAERMQHDGFFETLLQSRFPSKQLTVRNLGWSADEIDLRPRSANFSDHGHNLADHKPDVVLAMFGLNESFSGRDGLDAFKMRLEKFVADTRGQIGAKSQLVVFSPIPHENLGRSHLPDGTTTNENIQLYSAVMRDVADAMSVRFVDLMEPMAAAMKEAKAPLTINGIHLNEHGNEVLAAVIDVSLFGPRPAATTVNLEQLRAEIVEKNRQFFFDHRAVNGYYIYGGRKNPYGVVNFPEEFAKLRKMIAVRDRRIWDVAQNRAVLAEIDDSQTGALTPITTNVSAEIPYLSPEQSKEMFNLADGFEIDLVVSEVDFPEMVNPVALDIDSKGRLWVTTNPSYPQYLPGTPVDDKILIYEDTSGDGKADKQTVFADKLHLPIGIALGDGGAYVSQQPDLMFLKDTDGDGVADVRQRVLHGFDSADSHHALSAFTFGPDGALYFQEGTFHFSQVETPYGPQRVRDAAVFRYEPKTEKFNIFVSYNFANPWGHCFDYWGQNFVADASPGANYFAAAFSGDVIYPHKHRKMEQFLVKQWRPTAGCVIASSRQFPDSVQGNYLINNTIGFLGTLQYQMSDDGSGFKAAPVEPLLSSRDTNFRPIDIKFGPDGALYIVDWFNPLIGHMQHNLRDPNRDKHHGRIWRVRYKDKPLLEIPKIEGAPVADVVRLLERYEDSVRHLARMELRNRDTDNVATAIDAWLAEQTGNDEQSEHNRLEALWVMQHHDRVRRDLLVTVLASNDQRARAAATRVLSYWRDRIEGANELLTAAARDESARVRLEAVRAASFFADADQGRLIVDAAMTKPLDYYLNYAITETNTTLDRRGGTRATGDDALIQRIASGQVEDAQVVPMVQAALRNANAAQAGRLADAILAGDFSAANRAAALRDLVIATQSKQIIAAVDIELASRRLAAARQAGDGELIIRIADLAASWSVEELIAALRETARDPATPGEAVDAALQAIVASSTPSGSDTRGQFVRDDLPSGLRLRFARAVANVSSPQAAQSIANAIRTGITAKEGELLVRAAEAVLATKDGVAQLTKNLEQVSPDADSSKWLLRSLFGAQVNSGPLVEKLSQTAGISGPTEPLTPEQRQALVRRIDAQGDPHRGQMIYRRKELNCIQCHILSGAGGNVGPDLSGVGVTSPTEYLLDSILTPSSVIKEAYLTLQVLTADGVVIRGVKVDRDDQRLILRDETGREIVIPEDEIEQESEGKSLMPEGLHHLLTEDELVDLVAFLSALGKPGDFVVNTRPTLNRYELLVDENWVAKLAKLPKEKLEGELKNVPTEAWQPVYSMVNGTLPRAAFAANKPQTLILRGAIDVVVAGPLGVKATAESKVQVMVNGKSINGNGADQVELSPGKHSIYLIIEETTPVAALVTEVIKPTSAATQFTVVGGY